MPIIRDFSITLEMEQILRWQGLGRRKKIRPHILGSLQELLQEVDCLHLLKPAISFEIYPLLAVQEGHLTLEGGFVLHSSLLSSQLASAKELAFVACSIGSSVEEKITSYFQKDDLLRATLLDGIGNAAMDVLSQEICGKIQQTSSAHGYEASSPISPGKDGFPLLEQKTVCHLAHAEEIGIHLTSSMMMVPRKSSSMVFGLGENMPIWKKGEECQHCNLKNTCRLKRTRRE
jgi:hypothetical protein